MKHFKWYDANEEKPEQGVRVLLKIQYKQNPVVGYWTGKYWEVCTDNMYAESDCCCYATVEGYFDDSEVVAYMYIDMEG